MLWMIAHRHAVAVDGAEPHRIAGVGGLRPGQRALRGSIRAASSSSTRGPRGTPRIVAHRCPDRRRCRSRTMNACLVASISPWIWSKPSASARRACRTGPGSSARRALASAAEIEQLRAAHAARTAAARRCALCAARSAARHGRADAREIGRDLPRQRAAIEIFRPLRADASQRARRAPAASSSRLRAATAIDQEVGRNPARPSVRRASTRSARCWLAVTGKPCSRRPRRIFDQARQRQPAAISRLSVERLAPARNAPATVFAASGPRQGIAAMARALDTARSSQPRRRAASVDGDGSAPPETSQKPSPPIAVICG